MSLGYTQQELSVEIPQARVNLTKGLCSFFYTPQIYGDYILEVEKYRMLCNTPEKLKTKIIRSGEIAEDTIIFAIQDGVEENFNSFLAINANSNFVLTSEKIRRLGQIIPSDNPIFLDKGILHVNHRTYIDISHLRVFAKIAFNFLALTKGPEFVLSNQFDPLRSWIANGGARKFANYDFEYSKPFESNSVNFPEDAHWVYIMKTQNTLFAKVVLYNKVAANVQLATDYTDSFVNISLVCDWRNRKEYSFTDLIKASTLGY